MRNIYRCEVCECINNQDEKCNENVEIDYIKTPYGYRPICDNYEEKE